MYQRRRRRADGDSLQANAWGGALQWASGRVNAPSAVGDRYRGASGAESCETLFSQRGARFFFHHIFFLANRRGLQTLLAHHCPRRDANRFIMQECTTRRRVLAPLAAACSARGLKTRAASKKREKWRAERRAAAGCANRAHRRVQVGILDPPTSSTGEVVIRFGRIWTANEFPASLRPRRERRA